MAKKHLLVGALALILCAATAPRVTAQDGFLTELYGRGVHAYFAGRYTEAHGLLTAAIEQGHQDPRSYYFRGLSATRMGWSNAAEQDFRRGALLEVTNDSRSYPIGRSLERVQGSDRLRLEKFRQEGRLQAHQNLAQRNRARYESLRRAEGEGILRGAESPQAADRIPRLPAGAPDDPTDPFAGAAPAATPTPRTPAPATSPAPADDLFGDDVFGAPAANGQPTVERIPTQDNAAGGTVNSIFRALGRAMGDESETAPSAEADDPFGELPTPPAAPPADTTDDPFGELPAPPAEEMPLDEAVDDPFGDDAEPAPGTTTPPAADDSAEENDPFN